MKLARPENTAALRNRYAYHAQQGRLPTVRRKQQQVIASAKQATLVPAPALYVKQENTKLLWGQKSASSALQTLSVRRAPRLASIAGLMLQRLREASPGRAANAMRGLLGQMAARAVPAGRGSSKILRAVPPAPTARQARTLTALR